MVQLQTIAVSVLYHPLHLSDRLRNSHEEDGRHLETR
jgi:hypothetical protein